MPTAKFIEHLERLMVATGAKSDSELAHALGIQPPSVAAARKRQKILGSWIETIAEETGTSSDWLLFGRGGGTACEARTHEIPQIPRVQTGIAPDYRDQTIPQMEAVREGGGCFRLLWRCNTWRRWTAKIAGSPWCPWWRRGFRLGQQFRDGGRGGAALRLPRGRRQHGSTYFQQ